MKKYLTIAIAIFSGHLISAQDFHLAQYDAANLYMNPATTGMFEGKPGSYRITSNYRAQWRALGLRPFNTAYVSYDQPLEKTDGKWGVGGFLLNNNAAPGMFRTMQVMASGAYDIMNTSSEHYLTAGVQMGIIYKSFNHADYTFSEQYDSQSGTFDQSLEDGENFTSMSLVRFDAAVGIHYKYVNRSEKYHPYGSFSINHLTKPNESFTATKSKLPMRFNMQAGCDMEINDDLIISPRFLYMNQAKAWEANGGFLLYYKIKNSTLDAIVGCDYRHKDAIVAHLGFRQGNSVFRFSYDVNTSGLNGYTNSRGAWEFSLILVGSKNEPLLKPIF